ncbi:hypothetical protein DL768_008812 [Monosporascus sp. mg162]|nr:hypothetical protein DL768_008812 [Monosporascus sp. mg162]
MHTLVTWRYSPPNDNFELKSADRKLGSREVLTKTTHSGLCHTDVHAKSKGCGLGHEGVGRIAEIGSEVSTHKVSDRVGWGGYRQYCPDARGFANHELDQGAFGDYAIWDEAFVYVIPGSVSSVSARPLIPPAAWRVVGIGGLGHMAVLFAKAMGCAVTAFSGREVKKDDAFQLGADFFRTTSTPNTVWRNPKSLPAASIRTSTEPGINTLLICTNEVPSFEPLLRLLERQATIILLTIQSTPLVIPFVPFILLGHRIVASTETSRQNHIAMLQFAARNNIQPWLEMFPMKSKGLKEAFRKLETGEMRFRGVLVKEPRG